MTRSPDNAAREALPPALPSMWRLCKLGYQHEPGLIVAAFSLALLSALPDALLALWFKMLGEGVLQSDWTRVRVAVLALGVSATATWFLQTVSTRVHAPLPRQGDDRARGARGHAARIDSDHCAPGAARLSRSPVGAAQSGLHARSHVHVAVLDVWVDPAARRDDRAARCRFIPALGLLALFALPPVSTSTWRPAVERTAYERGAASGRLARHLFDMATTAAPGKEVRVTGIADRLVEQRRQAWERSYAPIAAARWASAGWHTLAWAMFGAAYVGAIVFVASGIAAPAGDVLLALAAGARLSSYVGATVGEIGFLRIWMDSARRLAWLEDYAQRWSQRQRTSPRPRASLRASASITSRLRIRAPIASSSTMSISNCRPARSSPSSARTAPASPRSSSSWRRCTSRQRAAS